MLGSSRTFPSAIAAIVAAGAALAAACYADPPLQLAPRESVLLLRNGQVLSGKITPAGDYYLVSLSHGEIRVQTSKVDVLCKDLQEAYEYKRARIKLGSAADHVALADWCMHNELFDLAETELSYALAADVNYPRIRLIERRLKLARHDAKPAPPRAKSGEPGPTNEELDRFIRGMPGGAVESFTSAIQPLLVNTCTTGGCHSPQAETKLQLLRIPHNSAASRRTTQRNLFAVWRYVDLADPAASPLLTVPLEQHGNAKAAMFTNHEADQYRQLAAWVGEVSRGKKPSQPATVTQPAAALLQTMPPGSASQPAEPNVAEPNAAESRKGRSRAAKKDPRLAEAEPSDEFPEMGAAASPFDPPAETGPQASAERKPRAPDYRPVDPFDPEIFNRQFFQDEK